MKRGFLNKPVFFCNCNVYREWVSLSLPVPVLEWTPLQVWWGAREQDWSLTPSALHPGRPPIVHPVLTKSRTRGATSHHPETEGVSQPGDNEDGEPLLHIQPKIIQSITEASTQEKYLFLICFWIKYFWKAVHWSSFALPECCLTHNWQFKNKWLNYTLPS